MQQHCENVWDLSQSTVALVVENDVTATVSGVEVKDIVHDKSIVSEAVSCLIFCVVT